MKEIKSFEPVLLEEYGIHVNRYLTYAQIQQIVNAVIKFDTWAEREQNIDMLVLYHATDIGAEKLEEIGIDTLLCSGVLDKVKNCVENLWDIEYAIKYTESTQRALAQIVKDLPEYTGKFKELMSSGNKAEK